MRFAMRLDPVWRPLLALFGGFPSTMKLRFEAAKKGIGPTTLVRMWAVERRQEQQQRKAPSHRARRAASRTRRAG